MLRHVTSFSSFGHSMRAEYQIDSFFCWYSVPFLLFVHTISLWRLSWRKKINKKRETWWQRKRGTATDSVFFIKEIIPMFFHYNMYRVQHVRDAHPDHNRAAYEPYMFKQFVKEHVAVIRPGAEEDFPDSNFQPSTEKRMYFVLVTIMCERSFSML